MMFMRYGHVSYNALASQWRGDICLCATGIVNLRGLARRPGSFRIPEASQVPSSPWRGSGDACVTCRAQGRCDQQRSLDNATLACLLAVTSLKDASQAHVVCEVFEWPPSNWSMKV